MSGAESPEEQAPPVHRSLADGDLRTAWAIDDFFGSLNDVLLLPQKPRKTSSEAAVSGRTFRSRLPTGAIIAMFIMSFCLLAGGQLLARGAGGGAHLESLGPVLGVWKATSGRHVGRAFSLTDSVVAFSTTDAGGFSLHEIERVRTLEATDSTLFTVTYREARGTSDFVFWHYPNRGTIQFKNASESVWSRAGGASPARSSQ